MVRKAPMVTSRTRNASGEIVPNIAHGLGGLIDSETMRLAGFFHEFSEIHHLRRQIKKRAIIDDSARTSFRTKGPVEVSSHRSMAVIGDELLFSAALGPEHYKSIRKLRNIELKQIKETTEQTFSNLEKEHGLDYWAYKKHHTRILATKIRANEAIIKAGPSGNAAVRRVAREAQDIIDDLYLNLPKGYSEWQSAYNYQEYARKTQNTIYSFEKKWLRRFERKWENSGWEKPLTPEQIARNEWNTYSAYRGALKDRDEQGWFRKTFSKKSEFIKKSEKAYKNRQDLAEKYQARLQEEADRVAYWKQRDAEQDEFFRIRNARQHGSLLANRPILRIPIRDPNVIQGLRHTSDSTLGGHLKSLGFKSFAESFRRFFGFGSGWQGSGHQEQESGFGWFGKFMGLQAAGMGAIGLPTAYSNFKMAGHHQRGYIDYYHGTPIDNAEKILKEGLVPNARDLETLKGAIPTNIQEEMAFAQIEEKAKHVYGSGEKWVSKAHATQGGGFGPTGENMRKYAGFFGYYNPDVRAGTGEGVIFRMRMSTDSLTPQKGILTQMESVLGEGHIGAKFLDTLTQIFQPSAGPTIDLAHQGPISPDAFLDYENTKTGNVTKLRDVAEDFKGTPSTKKALGRLGMAMVPITLLGIGAYMMFSGKDDDYNTIEGLRHGGMAEQMRKQLTDFGSGWIRRAIKLGIGQDKIAEAVRRSGKEVVSSRTKQSGEFVTELFAVGKAYDAGGMSVTKRAQSLLSGNAAVYKVANKEGFNAFRALRAGDTGSIFIGGAPARAYGAYKEMYNLVEKSGLDFGGSGGGK